mgnify:CR=1 FL=1
MITWLVFWSNEAQRHYIRRDDEMHMADTSYVLVGEFADYGIAQEFITQRTNIRKLSISSEDAPAVTP